MNFRNKLNNKNKQIISYRVILQLHEFIIQIISESKCAFTHNNIVAIEALHFHAPIILRTLS